MDVADTPIASLKPYPNNPRVNDKAVDAVAASIRNHKGDVYDPFLGSGTTMIAAEQLGRRCWRDV